MSALVELGAERLIGEVVGIDAGRTTVQAYEYTGGLAPGAVATAGTELLSARLGPGLLGGVFDGLLRPLDEAGTWLTPGQLRPSARQWHFVPSVGAGMQPAPGQEIGIVRAAGSVDHHVLVPPDVSGLLREIQPEGDYDALDIIAVVGNNPIRLESSWPVRQPRPYSDRQPATAPLLTGQRVIDVLFPLARGSCAAVPGGFGTGKTVLLQQIAKWCDADVIVYVGCGERGNELADVLDDFAALEDPRTQGRLLDRTVIIANTSNMPMMARETSIYTGVTVAEYFRDMGYHAVLIADSTSRWAEALREFASRSGALPVEEGYPADLASALAAFYGRAGNVTTLGGRAGSVTLLAAVSPPGGDMTEPVTAHTQRFVRCLWSLDHDLAYARHYPAVSWSDSFAQDTELLARWYVRTGDAGWGARRAQILAILAEADRLASLADLIGVSALPGRERMVLLGARLLREGVLQQSALAARDAYCPPGKAAALGDLVLEVVRRCQELVRSGRPAASIESLDFSPLLRAKDEIGPQDEEAVRARLELVLSTLEEPT
jgi:V/A-type H+-transporting ATPase subunit A